MFVSTLRSSAWASSIAEHLDGDHFHDQRGHAFVDLDRDGWVELLWSEDEDSIHMLQYDPYAGRLESRVALFEPGIGGALDRGFFADVNGDGVGDLIEPARMRWFPIRLVGPNFGAQLLLSDPLALDLPVATLKDELGDVVPPLHVNPDWETSADEYLRSQIRFGDVNGDGLVDIAVSLFARWEEHPDCENNALLCRFHPDVESLYSEIWFGDGYGYFIRSGLSAGPPALLELPGEADTRNRTWVTTFALQDLDRSGYPELLASRAAAGGSMSMWASRFRGLHEGFAFAREDIHFEYETRLNGTQQHGYAIDVPNDYALGVDYTGGGDVCFEKSVVPVFADFDGDGFAERLTVEAATDPAQTDCNTTFCVTYAENRRTHSRGRITSSKNEWGGTTSLGWGFSGSALHDNPDLPNNVEVLERVVGSEGEVQLRYGRGALSRHAGFTGFGLIERKNPRGGVDAFAYNTVPALSGLPLYSARYRTSGELERLTVFVHGRTVSGKALELELLPDSDAPAYNPLIRQCDYELALQSSESVGDLIHHCFGLDRSVSRKPSKSSILAASGLWRHPPDAPSFEGDDAPFQLAAVAWGDVAAVTSIQLSNLEQTNSPDGKFVLGRLTPSVQSVDWRKPLPQNAAAPPAPLLGTGYLSHRPPAMAKVDTTAYVVDRAFDHDTLKPIEEVAWRDLSTTGDDLVTRYDWEEHPDHPGAHRLRSQATVDASGAAIRARTVAAFAAQGFDRPAEVQRCGSDPGACVSERYSWFENGDLRAHTDAAGATTRWLAEDACGDRTLVDPLGRRRELRRDSLCRLSRETWLARTTSMTYDGFGRVETRLDEPGAGEPAKLTRTYWNDPLLDDESAPRFCTTDEAGKRVVVHLDDFGRETRRDTCWQENAVVPPLPGARTPKAPVGNLPALGCGCAPGSAVSRLTAYGTDGKVMGTSAPHYASGEQPVFERVARDGAGREIVLVSPAPVTGGRPAWVTERTFFAPSLEESKDALGVTSIRRTSTLRHEKRRADRMVESSEQNAAGWITSSTGPDGVAIAIEHDPFGRPSRTRTVEMGSCLDRSGRPGASCTRSEQARYDAVGRLVWKARADGTRVEYSYDGVGRPLTEEQSSSSGVQRVVSRAWSYGRDAEQRPWVRITDDTGAWTNTTVDGLGRTVLESDSYGIRKTIDYAGASGRSEVRSQVNDGTFAGEWVTVTDASGRVVATTAPDSGTTRYRHNGRGQVVSETDADGVERSYSYLLNGALEEETLGGYTVASFKYDEAGRVVREVRDGVVNARTYDALGRVESITTGEPSQDVLRLQYDGVSERVLVETKTAGSERASTSYSYDAWGRLSSVTDPAGHVEHYTYDAADRLRLHTDAEGYERETRYDYRGRIVYQEGNGPDFTTYTYGVLPKLRLTGAPSVEVEHVRTVAATNAQGRTSTTFTDARGRLWATLRPDGTRTENVFDGSRPSETLSVDAHGTRTASTALIYDAETGREVGTLGPYTPESRPDERYRVDRTLSRAGRLLSLDAAGEGTSFEYGSDHGLLVAERYHGLERRLERAKPARGVSSVVVAEALHRQDGLGLARSTRFARDPAGRLAEVVVKLGSDVQTTRYRDR
ncbi:MAG TPA: hypothetical protein VGK73_24220, partial [Polyangiaceae bacterium]